MLPPTFTREFLMQLEVLRLRSRRAFLGTRQGGHVSPKRGHGIEFSDYRKYELGDNPRHIDWGLYARTDRLYIKRFQEEQDLHVLIILDTSASMGIPADHRKWETARDIAIALAYVSLMEQDNVSVAALGAWQSPMFFGARAIHSLSEMLLRVSLGALQNPVAEMQRAAMRIRFPGVALVISDFLMPFDVIDEWFLALRARNLDVTAIQVLGQADINPLNSTASALAIDSETGQELELSLDEKQRSDYGILLMQHNQLLKQYLFDCRIPYALALSSQTLIDIIQGSVSETGLLRT